MRGKGGWLSTTEVRDQLGITLRTLYRLIDEGQIPAYKIGRVIRMKEADVEAFLNRSRIEPGTLEHLYPARADGLDGDGDDLDGPL